LNGNPAKYLHFPHLTKRDAVTGYLANING